MDDAHKELVKRLRVAEVGESFQTEDGSPELLPTELGLDAADALEALAGEVERLTMEAKTATTLLEAEKWSRAHVKSIIVSDLEAERARLKAALARLVKSVGDECFLDHNGNCQTHFIDSPCAMAIARKALGDAS